MRIVPLIAILSLAAPLGAREASSSAAKPCKPSSGVAVAKNTPMHARPLAKEPPAAEVKAVYRLKDGCTAPLVTRTGIGVRNGTPAEIARAPAGMHRARN